MPEPSHEGPIGAPPEYLSKVQAKIWFELCADAPQGALTQAERPILVDYCRLEAILRQYEIESANYTGVGKPPKPPDATVYSARRNILGTFGMTHCTKNFYSGGQSQGGPEIICYHLTCYVSSLQRAMLTNQSSG